ncbi:MAG: 6-hydroxymethylpterin diphosphokinase MptE-like protein [Succinivibrio sp.]|jgi:hypothetical protein|nr:6-hydroxymethylpterin diphosphokinase MptE-like protein [Succinivibrio sp.]
MNAQLNPGIEKALLKTCPAFARALKALLENAPWGDPQVRVDEGKEQTLLADGRQLTSRYRRSFQAERALRNIDFNQDVWLYGLGLGDEVRLALNKLAPRRRIRVQVLCPRLFAILSSADSDFIELIREEVSFELPENGSAPAQNRAVILPELSLEERFVPDLKLRLRAELDEAYAKECFERGPGLRIRKNVQDNLPLLQKEQPYRAAELGVWNEALVLCSGPSLKRDLKKAQDLLKAHPGMVTVAADTALAFLEPLKLIPDYAVSIDDLAGWHAGTAFFKDLSLYRCCTLLYSAASLQRLWLDYPGRRRYLLSERIIKNSPALKERGGDALWGSGSVALTAVSLCLAQGARAVYLLGADFAADEEYTHAGIKRSEDRFINGDFRLKVSCNDGASRPTLRNFIVYREDLENLIALRKDTRFVNLSSRGAVIRGCERG